MIWRCSLAVFVTALAASLIQAAPIVDSFDGPVSPGWVVDRYAPAVFQGGVSAFGRTAVRHEINAADFQANAFYNTQGMQHALPSGSTSIAVDLYIPASWAADAMVGPSQRMAGLWGVGRDAADAISWYPIIEFGQNDSFRVWNNGVWEDLGQPTGFTMGDWVTLLIELDVGSDVFNFSVGDLTHTTPAGGSQYIDAVILQGHNAGRSYDIYWDNLQVPDAATVPEPASVALWSVLGLLGATWGLRTRLRAS